MYAHTIWVWTRVVTVWVCMGAIHQLYGSNTTPYNTIHLANPYIVPYNTIQKYNTPCLPSDISQARQVITSPIKYKCCVSSRANTSSESIQSHLPTPGSAGPFSSPPRVVSSDTRSALAAEKGAVDNKSVEYMRSVAGAAHPPPPEPLPPQPLAPQPHRSRLPLRRRHTARAAAGAARARTISSRTWCSVLGLHGFEFDCTHLVHLMRQLRVLRHRHNANHFSCQLETHR